MPFLQLIEGSKRLLEFLAPLIIGRCSTAGTLSLRRGLASRFLHAGNRTNVSLSLFLRPSRVFNRCLGATEVKVGPEIKATHRFRDHELIEVSQAIDRREWRQHRRNLLLARIAGDIDHRWKIRRIEDGIRLQYKAAR